MKYVTRLQAELAAAEDENRAMRDAVAEFRCHLAGPKFSGTEPDGGRKDWIAVADVNAWLARVLQAGAPPRLCRAAVAPAVPPILVPEGMSGG